MTIITTRTFSNADATNVVTIDGSEPAISGVEPQGIKFHKHQIAFDIGDNATGTIAILATGLGLAAAIPVRDSLDAAIVLDVATDDLLLALNEIEYTLQSFSFTFADLDGDDDVVITVASW
jgi:hypothetical protein